MSDLQVAGTAAGAEGLVRRARPGLRGRRGCDVDRAAAPRRQGGRLCDAIAAALGAAFHAVDELLFEAESKKLL